LNIPPLSQKPIDTEKKSEREIKTLILIDRRRKCLESENGRSELEFGFSDPRD
jgi:hypothetical protein